MTRKRKCHSKSNSFVGAAEQVCLQSVLAHRQRRGRRNIACQAVSHLCSSNRKVERQQVGTSSCSVEADVSLRRCGMSATHVNDDTNQVRWCGAMQCTIRQRRHLEKLDGTSGGVDTNAHPFPPPSNQIKFICSKHVTFKCSKW